MMNLLPLFKKGAAFLIIGILITGCGYLSFPIIKASPSPPNRSVITCVGDKEAETTAWMKEHNPGLVVLGAFWGKDYGDLAWRISMITGNEVMPSGDRALIYWVEKRETVWVVVFNKHGCRVDQGPIPFEHLDFLIGLDTTEV